MISDPFNPGAFGFAMVEGMSPGGNMSPITAQTNLSALLGSVTLTQQNAALVEEFGVAAQTSTATNNPYDLTGTTFNADRQSPGVYLIY
jgi:hypothetical protein